MKKTVHWLIAALALAGSVSVGTVSQAADAPKDVQACESPADNPVIQWYCELTGER